MQDLSIICNFCHGIITDNFCDPTYDAHDNRVTIDGQQYEKCIHCRANKWTHKIRTCLTCKQVFLTSGQLWKHLSLSKHHIDFSCNS